MRVSYPGASPYSPLAGEGRGGGPMLGQVCCEPQRCAPLPASPWRRLRTELPQTPKKGISLGFPSLMPQSWFCTQRDDA